MVTVPPFGSVWCAVTGAPGATVSVTSSTSSAVAAAPPSIGVAVKTTDGAPAVFTGTSMVNSPPSTLSRKVSSPATSTDSSDRSLTVPVTSTRPASIVVPVAGLPITSAAVAASRVVRGP